MNAILGDSELTKMVDNIDLSWDIESKTQSKISTALIL